MNIDKAIEVKDPLESLLVIKRYRVRRILNRMVAFPDPDGRYRADSADKVERALTERFPLKGVEVLIGNRWYPVKRARRWGI